MFLHKFHIWQNSFFSRQAQAFRDTEGGLTSACSWGKPGFPPIPFPLGEQFSAYPRSMWDALNAQNSGSCG